MKTRTIFTAALALISVSVFAQALPVNQKSTDIQVKIRQIDLMNNILPVLFRKDQLQQILPLIERARQAEANLLKQEEKILRDLEPSLDSAIKEGTEKQVVAKPELITKILNTFKGMQLARQVLSEEHVEKTLKLCEQILDEGQKKAAINALDPGFYKGKDPKSFSDRDKLKFFVGGILMDPLSYDLLLKLNRNVK